MGIKITRSKFSKILERKRIGIIFWVLMILLNGMELSFSKDKGANNKKELVGAEWKINYQVYHRKGFIPMKLEKKIGKEFEETYLFDKKSWMRKKGNREVEVGHWYVQNKKFYMYKKTKDKRERILGFGVFKKNGRGKKQFVIQRIDFDFNVKYILKKKKTLLKTSSEEGFGRFRSRINLGFERIEELVDEIK